MANEKTPTMVITSKVRMSYCHVFEPKAVEEGQKKKYSVCLLIRKDDEITLSRIEEAVEAAKKEGQALWGGKIPKKLKLPLRDGEEERDGEEYIGMMFVNANSDRKPTILDRDKEEIFSKDEFYSGCWGRASLKFYPFKGKSNGIACGLNHLQFIEDGDPLGGGTSAFDDFDDDFDDDLDDI